MTRIIDDWVLIADENNYVIARHITDKINKKGVVEHVLRNKSYYTTLEAAFRGLRAQMERQVLSADFQYITAALGAVLDSNNRLEMEFRRIRKELELG